MLTLDLSWGRVEIEGNEVSILSTVEDPPAVRLAALSGGSLGKWSFNRLRPDGQQEELVLLQGKVDERTPDTLSGELTLHIRADDPTLSDDAQMRHVVTFRHDQILINPRVAIVTGD